MKFPLPDSVDCVLRELSKRIRGWKEGREDGRKPEQFKSCPVRSRMESESSMCLVIRESFPHARSAFHSVEGLHSIPFHSVPSRLGLWLAPHIYLTLSGLSQSYTINHAQQ